ncbi:MAG: DUF1491 family protein [Magnetovibrionaceae bacterium]
MARLKTGIWVGAERRLCEAKALPLTIVHKGHEEAGMVLIKHYMARDRVTVFQQTRNMEGKLIWRAGTGEEPVGEFDADEYIQKQRRFDPDLWVIEIDDPKGGYEPSPYPERG